MLFFWLASVVFLALLAFLFRIERRMLLENRARNRALLIDGVRLASVAAMFLALPLAEPRPLATIGLGLAAFAFIAVPTTWMLAIGGIDPKWDLRKVQEEAASLMAEHPSPMEAEGAERMKQLIRYVRGLRRPETSELCDLLVARYSDWLRGEHRPLALGRRSIRIYDLQRELYPEDVRPTELSQEEATFRWRLYRTLMGMVECGVTGQTPEQEAAFRELAAGLSQFRRKDTAAIIKGWQASARSWLKKGRENGPWRPGSGARPDGPTFEDLRGELWPRTSIFWGAVLDEEDRRELRAASPRG